MTYAEFLRRCLAADAWKTGPPAADLIRQVIDRLRGPADPGPPKRP